MPISHPDESIGMTYEDAVSLHLNWNGTYPLIEATSKMIKRIVTADETKAFVLVNVDASGALRPCNDGDGFDAVILPEEAERLGFVKTEAGWSLP